MFEQEMIIKTCGRTRTLVVLPRVVELAAARGLAVAQCFYSRKNFMFTSEQSMPYRAGFDAETAELSAFFPSGRSFTFGADGVEDEYHLFAAGRCVPTERSADKFELLMMGSCEPALRKFFEVSAAATADETMRECGFPALFPAAPVVNAHQFSPCGFSFNAIAKEFWGTMHVTPEQAFSYVSYECNDAEAFARSAPQLLALFRPARAVVISLGACAAPACDLHSLDQYEVALHQSATLPTEQALHVASLTRAADDSESESSGSPTLTASNSVTSLHAELASV